MSYIPGSLSEDQAWWNPEDLRIFGAIYRFRKKLPAYKDLLASQEGMHVRHAMCSFWLLKTVSSQCLSHVIPHGVHAAAGEAAKSLAVFLNGTNFPQT